MKSQPNQSAALSRIAGSLAANPSTATDPAPRHSAVDYRKWDRVGRDEEDDASESSTRPACPPPLPPAAPPLPPPLDTDEALQWLRNHGPTEEEQVALADMDERLSAPDCRIEHLLLDPAAGAAAGPNAAAHLNADHVLPRAGRAVLAACDAVRVQPSLVRLGVRHALWCQSVDAGVAAASAAAAGKGGGGGGGGGGGAADAAAVQSVLAWVLLESCAAESAAAVRRRLTGDAAALRGWVEAAVVPAYVRCTRERCGHADYLREIVGGAGEPAQRGSRGAAVRRPSLVAGLRKAAATAAAARGWARAARGSLPGLEVQPAVGHCGCFRTALGGGEEGRLREGRGWHLVATSTQ
jgi:hypothetical protein